MTNKKQSSQLGKVAQGLDWVVLTLFILGVLVIIGLFVYVLTMDVATKV